MVKDANQIFGYSTFLLLLVMGAARVFWGGLSGLAVLGVGLLVHLILVLILVKGGKVPVLAIITFAMLELVLMLAILFPVFAQAPERPHRPSCISRIKQVAISLLIYSSDYDDTMPPARGWKDASYVYTKNQDLYRCLENSSYSYAYNRAVAGKKVKAGLPIENTVLLFATKATPGSSGTRSILAPDLHEGKINIALASGRVHRVTPEEAEGLQWAAP